VNVPSRVAALGGPEHRLGTTTIRVTDAAGAPLADTEVVVEQIRHAFAFGNIGFDLIGLANGRVAPGDAELAERYLEVFNTATLPFYWREFEPEPGRPRTDELRRAAEWFRDRGVTVKGHPLAWHTLAPPGGCWAARSTKSSRPCAPGSVATSARSQASSTRGTRSTRS
jgi:endo-1,4-beta-xylanase